MDYNQLSKRTDRILQTIAEKIVIRKVSSRISPGMLCLLLNVDIRKIKDDNFYAIREQLLSGAGKSSNARQ